MSERSPVPQPRSGQPARRPGAKPPAVAAPARTSRQQRIADRRARRRRIIAGLLPAQIALAAIVLIGMATGLHAGNARGPASGSTVVTVQTTGAVCLVLLGLGIGGGIALRRGRGRRFPWWALVSIPMFVFWAALRVSEYSG